MSKVARRGGAILLAGALTLSMAACGSKDDSSSTGSGEEEKPASIQYWSHWKKDEPQQKVLAQAIADWEQKTGIKVDAQWQGRSITQKLTPALNTKNVPDLVDTSFARLAPVLAETKQAVSLEDAFKIEVEDGKTVGDLIPSKYIEGSGLVIDGKPWLLPYTISSEAVWFNAAKHPEFKENPPKTWDEFVEVLRQLKAKGETPLAQDGDIGGYNAFWMVSGYVKEHGPGSFHKLAEDATGEAWKSPEVLEIAKRVETLVKEGMFIDGYNASKFPAQQQAWATNKAVFLVNGSWLPTETSTYSAEGFEYASFPQPAKQQDKTYARADFIGFAIPQKADAKKWAADLAAFTLQKKYQQAFADEAKVLPVRDDIQVDPVFEPVMNAIKEADATYQQNDSVTFSGYIEKVFWPTQTELVLGNITAEEFVQMMAEKQAQYWKEQG